MKFLFRAAGLTLLCLAAAALVYDGIRMLANGGLVYSTLEELWRLIKPAGFEAIEIEPDSALGLVWTAVIYPLLLFPAWMVLGGGGSLIYLIGYRPRPPEIVADL